MIQWLQGKKMYLAAIGIAIAAIVFFFLNQLDAQGLTMYLLAAAAVCGLSAKLNRFLPDIVLGVSDLKSKDFKGALTVGASDLLQATTGVAQSTPSPSVVVNVHPPAAASTEKSS
jgi:hypothetical protein